jgi:ribonucleoside-diphosphate reductase alpha chain
VATAFARSDKVRMETAMTGLATLQQETARGFATPAPTPAPAQARSKKDANVAELARQLAEQLDQRAKARIARDNLELDRAAEARVKGYEGESCRECGNFTLVRNGTCLKCDTCGGTSGCS